MEISFFVDKKSKIFCAGRITERQTWKVTETQKMLIFDNGCQCKACLLFYRFFSATELTFGFLFISEVSKVESYVITTPEKALEK